MREIGRDSGGSSIGEGLWFFKSGLPAMKKAAEEFAAKGVRFEVLGEEIFGGIEEVRVRITGGDSEHGLSSYWRRVEKIQEESGNVQELLAQ